MLGGNLPVEAAVGISSFSLRFRAASCKSNSNCNPKEFGINIDVTPRMQGKT